jgi:hypothetical protein
MSKVKELDVRCATVTPATCILAIVPFNIPVLAIFLYFKQI